MLRIGIIVDYEWTDASHFRIRNWTFKFRVDDGKLHEIAEHAK